MQARPRLESALFQNFNLNEEKLAFNLNLIFRSLRPYNEEICASGTDERPPKLTDRHLECLAWMFQEKHLSKVRRCRLTSG